MQLLAWSFNSYTLFVSLMALALGVVVGSFCNVVILRLPQMVFRELEPDPGSSTLNLLQPASHCPSCLHPLSAKHLAPIVSYFLLHGQCAFCMQPISSRYWRTETVVGLWWLFCAWKFQLLDPDMPLNSGQYFSSNLMLPQALSALLWATFGSALVCLAQIDWEHQLLPDAITQPFLWIGLLSANFGLLGITAKESLLGACTGYMSFWLIANIYRLLCARDGMGQGDMKLLAMLGAWLGPLTLIPLVLLASTSGAIVGIWRLKVNKNLSMNEPIAFGPFLIFASFALLFWGPHLALRFLGLGT
jgi:leader peptidase (prepilin peptidase)/N-methyltransferase